MLSPDETNLLQKDFDYMESTCMLWMNHYNFLLSLSIFNNEVDEFFLREHFNEYKWYDV